MRISKLGGGGEGRAFGSLSFGAGRGERGRVLTRVWFEMRDASLKFALYNKTTLNRKTVGEKGGVVVT